jgi:putative aldouronate transport system substrate-binding protein
MIFVLTSCDKNNVLPSGHSSIFPAENSYGLTEFELTRCLYFGDSTENLDLKEEWMKEYERLTGVKIKVNYPPRNTYRDNVNLKLASGELKGIVNFFTFTDVINAVENGFLEPLDSYLANNANWNSMSEEYKNSYLYNGKIYAINAGYTGNFFTRIIRADWLNNLQLNIPKTVYEIYDMAKAFTENDPDRNSKNDTYGLTTSNFWLCQDIFQAFDARLNNTGNGSIAWDPNEGAWIDSMLKPQMVDALNFMRELYKNRYIDNDMFTNSGSVAREKLHSGKCGSIFDWAMNGYEKATKAVRDTIPEARFIEIPGITGNATQNLNQRTMGGLIYGIVKGTKYVDLVINHFVDKFLFDEKVHLAARNGIEGKTFKLEGTTIIMQIDPQTGKPYAGAELVEPMPNFDFDKYPRINDGTIYEKEEQLSIINLKSIMLQEGLNEKLLFNVPSEPYNSPQSSTYAICSADINKIFMDAATKAVMGETTAEEAIQEYRRKMKALGADKILEEANQAIGKKSIQKY